MPSVGRVVLIALALMAIAAPSAHADARRRPLASTDESGQANQGGLSQC